MRSIREELEKFGFEFEGKYLLQRTYEGIRAIPYYHIRLLEVKGNKVIIHPGGLDKIVVELPSDMLARKFFEEILLHVERLHL